MEAHATAEILQKAFDQAVAFHQGGNLGQAQELYGLLLQYWPENAEVLRLLGLAKYQLGHPEESVALLERAIALQPDRAESYNYLANAQQGLGHLAEAVTNYGRALALHPHYAEALANRSVALNQLQRYDEALRDIDAALAIAPDSAASLNGRGNVLHRLGRLDEARQSYERALVLVPNYAEAHTNLGNVLREQGLFADALACYEQALAIAPDYALALNNRGNVFQNLRRFEEALADYNRALELAPAYADAYNNLGNVLQQMRYCEAAVAAYDHALAINPQLATACYNKATALQELKRFEEALDSCQRALAIDPDYPFALGDYLHLKMKLCHWAGHAEDTERLCAGIRQGAKVAAPLVVQTLVDSPEIQRKSAEIYAHQDSMSDSPDHLAPATHEGSKLRIGYFSSDFGDHPVSHLLAGLFEHHDRDRFEIFGFSLISRPGPWRERVEKAFDHFFELEAQPDQAVIQLARAQKIDIAIDLNGFTKFARSRIFAERVAPVQASYIGFLGTMGEGLVDYLIADRHLITPASRPFYAERIAYLPSYQCNDDRQDIAEQGQTRRDAGLPEGAIVFCSFNNNHKITPGVFALWMRILRRVPNSVLWLFVSNETARAHLLEEAARQDIAPDRLCFAARLPLAEHLQRQTLADLFLDTYPYNGGATASNALRVGLPVLTRCGDSFASRYGVSLLHAVGLPELVAESDEAYETLAVALAENPDQRQALRDRLARNLPYCPLFDTAAFVRHFESTLGRMHGAADDGTTGDIYPEGD